MVWVWAVNKSKNIKMLFKRGSFFWRYGPFVKTGCCRICFVKIHQKAVTKDENLFQNFWRLILQLHSIFVLQKFKCAVLSCENFLTLRHSNFAFTGIKLKYFHPMLQLYGVFLYNRYLKYLKGPLELWLANPRRNNKKVVRRWVF